MSEQPSGTRTPGTQPPSTQRPSRWRLHWELFVCGARGHELVGAEAAQLRQQDAIFARADASSTRWHRCLRCDSWMALPAPEHPARPFAPEREEIELPLRGKPLRDKIVLRLIAIDRAFHFVALAALGVLALIVNLAVVVYLLYAKRLFGLRGGIAAEEAESERDLGWQALQRTTPPAPSLG